MDEQYKLDKIDKAILTKLQENGRMSNAELSDAIGLSQTPCARRVKILQDKGIIKNTITVVDPTYLGINLTVFIGVSLDKHTSERFAEFENSILAFPEVISCSVVTGRVEDYIICVVVKDMKHYEEFLLGRLNKISGLTNVHSSFELRSVVKNRPLPIFD